MLSLFFLGFFSWPPPLCVPLVDWLVPSGSSGSTLIFFDPLQSPSSGLLLFLPSTTFPQCLTITILLDPRRWPTVAHSLSPPNPRASCGDARHLPALVSSSGSVHPPCPPMDPRRRGGSALNWPVSCTSSKTSNLPQYFPILRL